MSNCLFCQLVAREIPSNIIYEDEDLFAFHDIAPQAPVHFLVIPKKHIASLNEMAPEDQMLIGKIFDRIRKLAEELGLKEGYRIVNNCGEHGGQTVHHLHFHVLGKRHMLWPPG